jgi:hypothetical protein
LKFLKLLGWICVPFLMLPIQWKRIGKTKRILGSFWALLALIIALASSQPTSSIDATSQQSVKQASENAKADTEAKIKADADTKAKADADAKAKGDADAKAKADADDKAKADADAKAKADADAKAKADDLAYLNAVDKITYNTFVEAQNIGDQMKAVSSYKESMDEFANFVDTDVALWGMYIKNIQSTSPKDSFLNVTQQDILNDLNDLQKNATAMRDAAQTNDLGKVSKAGQNMLIAFNHIKQHYGEPVSQMDKYGIKPNWKPN